MNGMADQLGRLICRGIGALLHQCQTGESVGFIGYGAVALIVLVCGVLAFLRRVA